RLHHAEDHEQGVAALSVDQGAQRATPRPMPPLFLIGFMAAGKTTIGRAIAAATGRRFVDLDDVIAAAGEPVASLVARDEPLFRKREAAALADTIARAE